MKIFVFSDSHADSSRMVKVISKYNSQINAIIHLGDHDSDIERIMHVAGNIPIAAVAGNCDMLSTRRNEVLAEYEDKKFLLIHGQNLVSAGNYGGALKAAKDNKADAVLFGHTHIPFCRTVNGILLFNPGSISLPRGGSTYSFGIIEITDNKINAKCVDFEE